jgi:hypothetical protein
LKQALGLYRDPGDRLGQAYALHYLGVVGRPTGDYPALAQALDLACATASSWDEAHALAGLGRCALAAGHATQAEVLLRQALEIFQCR